MPVPYDPIVVANTFLAQHAAPGRGIDHLKLQKLVYCSYGWWLTTDEQVTPLCTEPPQVWPYGPVFASLYRQLRLFGSDPIEGPVSPGPFQEAQFVDSDDDQVRHLIDWVWSRYGRLSSFYLSELTHKSGTPWQLTAQKYNYRVPEGLPVPDDLIRKEFLSLLSANQTADPVL